MTSVIKGFPGPSTPAAGPRPPQARPFSNGSMTVDTSTLSALDSFGHLGHQAAMPAAVVTASMPYALPNSLPTGHYGYPLVSPRQDSLDLPHASHSFQPHGMFSQFAGFGSENREPPVNLPSQSSPDRSRSQSSSRSSLVGKAATSRSRPHRKQSMSDARPASVTAQPRGRLMQPPRSQSFQAQPSFGYGSVSAAPGGMPADASVGSPDFNIGRHFGFPLNGSFGATPEWQPGSAPSLLHGGMPGYGGSLEESVLESPMTPAHELQGGPPPSADETKKQRRRESHNQVEKRRREHINLMIDQLSKLLPERYQQIIASADVIDEDEDEVVGDQSPSKKKKGKRSMSTSKALKDSAQNKGQVLSNSVDYIMRLQEAVAKQQVALRTYEDMLGIKPTAATPDTLGAVAFSPTAWPSVTGLGLSAPPLQTPNYGRVDPAGALAFDTHQLQVMRGSPEPEQSSVDAGVTTWDQLTSATAPTNGMAFDHSPAPDYGRSDSASFSVSSPDTDNKDKVWDMLDLLHRQQPQAAVSDDPSPAGSSEGQRGRGSALPQTFSGLDMSMMIDDVRQDTAEAWRC